MSNTERPEYLQDDSEYGYNSSSGTSALRSSELNLKLLEEAEFLAMLGFRVLPLYPATKRPILPNGLHGASRDCSLVVKWWKRWPGANIGMVLDNLLVVDDDNPKHGGDTSATDRLSGPKVVTPSGGTHTYFARTPGYSRKINSGHIDILTGSCYVVMPPSVVASASYRWLSGDSRALTGVDYIPEAALAALSSRGRVSTGDLDLSLIGLGNRNNSLYGLGARLLAFGYPEHVVSLMVEYVASVIPGELETGEVQRILASLRTYGTRSGSCMWRTPTDRLSFDELDDKIALLSGVLRGADAREHVLSACFYAAANSVQLMFELTTEMVEKWVSLAMSCHPRLSHFLRRNGSSDALWVRGSGDAE